MKEPKLIPTLTHPKELIGKTITHVQMAEQPNDEQFNMIVLDGKYPFYAAGWQDLDQIKPMICHDTENEVVEQFHYYKENLKWLSEIGIVNYTELQSKFHKWLNQEGSRKKEKDINQLNSLIRQYPTEAGQALRKVERKDNVQ